MKSRTRASSSPRRSPNSRAAASRARDEAAEPTRFESRRAVLVSRIAALLLARGCAEIPLRELARELDTSDRMLLYYFEDKADLVTATLSAVSMKLAQTLQAALPSGRVVPARLLAQVSTILASRPLKPYMSVWADLVAHGTRGEEPYRTLMTASAAGWLDRIEASLEMAAGADRRRVAAVLLTIAEGSRMLEDALPGCTRDTLQIFVAGLEAQADASP